MYIVFIQNNILFEETISDVFAKNFFLIFISPKDP